MAQGSSRDPGHVSDEKDDTDKTKCNEIMNLRNKGWEATLKLGWDENDD